MDSVQIILLTIVVGLLAVVGFFYFSSVSGSASTNSELRKPTYLIVGRNGAGKTALFYKLQNRDEKISTVSSLEPNISSLALPFSSEKIQKPYQLIDFPGHLKHSQLLRKLILEDITVRKLKGIVYVVDSSSWALDQEANVAAMAREVFQLFSMTEKVPNGVDYLFAINKQDLFDSRPVHKVKQLLELELAKLVAEEVAAGRTAGSSGIDNDEEDDASGLRKEETTREFWRAAVGTRPFRFELLEGNVEFVGGSVARGAIEHWENWFDERAVNYGGM